MTFRKSAFIFWSLGMLHKRSIKIYNRTSTLGPHVAVWMIPSGLELNASLIIFSNLGDKIDSSLVKKLIRLKEFKSDSDQTLQPKRFSVKITSDFWQFTKKSDFSIGNWHHLKPDCIQFSQWVILRHMFERPRLIQFVFKIKSIWRQY